MIISNYKNIFRKSCSTNCSKETPVMKGAKKTISYTYVIKDLHTLCHHYKKNCVRRKS